MSEIFKQQRSANLDFFRNNCVIIGNKDVDFYLAVNNQIPLITPLWLSCEEKNSKYGLGVNNYTEAEALIEVMNNNQYWCACARISEVTTCISLYDAKTRDGQKSPGAISIANAFQSLLKKGCNKSYYRVLEYYFMANVTRESLFDDINVFGIMPSSNCSINLNCMHFVRD